MSDIPKPKNSSPQKPLDIERLRQTVLKWIADKPESPKPTPPKPLVKTPPPPPPPASLKPAKPKLKKEAAKISAPQKLLKPPSRILVNLKPKNKIIGLVAGITIVLIILIIVFGVLIYQFNWRNRVVLLITKIIPYPAVIVNFQPLTYYNLQTQTNTLIDFYQKEKERNQGLIIPGIIDTQKHILDRMVEQTIIEQTAKKYHLTVNTQEIEIQTQTLIEEIGSQQALTDQLANLYNWTIKDFQKQILYPLLLKNKLRLAVIFDDDINSTEKAQAEKVLTEIQAGEKSFEELAQQYSQDSTASRGGDLGYFAPGQMIAKFEQAAFGLQPGQTSGIVKTEFGYHIIKLNDLVADQTGQISQARASHILIRSKNFDQFLAEQKSAARIWQLIHL